MTQPSALLEKRPFKKIFIDEDDPESIDMNETAENIDRTLLKSRELSEREIALKESQLTIEEFLHNKKRSRTEKISEISQWQTNQV